MRKMILITLLLGLNMLNAVTVGEKVTTLTIGGDDGGTLNNEKWVTDSMKGKVIAFFYVDPDVKDLNDALGLRLKAEKFDKRKFQTVAVINLAATWMPNALIEMALKEKQKQFPNVMYVKDKNKVLVKKWNLEDDNSDVIIFDKDGKCIYKYFGKLSDKENDKIIALIKNNF
ncbi:YtfJ family protein [Sulfurimonas sp.]